MSYAPQAHFGNYDPSSFGWPHRVPDLVPLLYTSVVDGITITNFGQCARAFHPVAIAILTELEPHVLGGYGEGAHDDWAYSTTDDLPDGSWSFHRYGIAFDVNWRHNLMGDYATNPDAGQRGAIPTAVAIAIASKYGCEYGGQWSGGDHHAGFKDYMHFECHLSPQVARTVTVLNPPNRSEGFTMDNEAKAAFAALNARFDELAGEVWAYRLKSLMSGNPVAAGDFLRVIDSTTQTDRGTDRADLAADSPVAKP